LPIARRHNASKVRIFGSFARGDVRRSSDVDILVQMPARASLLDLIGLKQDLESALKRKLDLLTDDGLSPYLRERILREARAL
jgi:predicted nucleotidyltransferase